MKSVLITGGSSGIGYEMSKIWAQNGYTLYWISNDIRELEKSKELIQKEIPNVTVHSLDKDLTEENAAQEIFDWQQKLGSVDVLINNAGFGTYGYVNDIDVSKELSMIQLNVVGLYKMTRLFLAEMESRNEGTIINICSNTSFQPVPRMVTYAATKGFVSQFSRGLQSELEIKRSKVRVMTICPSAIRDTPFRQKLSSDIKTFDGLAYTTALEVAQDTWKGFQKRKSFVVTGRKMRILYAFRNLIPYSIEQSLVKKETERA